MPIRTIEEMSEELERNDCKHDFEDKLVDLLVKEDLVETQSQYLNVKNVVKPGQRVKVIKWL